MRCSLLTVVFTTLLAGSLAFAQNPNNAGSDKTKRPTTGNQGHVATQPGGSEIVVTKRADNAAVQKVREAKTAHKGGVNTGTAAKAGKISLGDAKVAQKSNTKGKNKN